MILAILFAGYKYYDANAKTVVSTGIPIMDKLQIEPVTRQEVIDYVLPSLYETCSKLENKEHVSECTYLLNYQKPFCLKVFDARSPELFVSEEKMIDRMASLTNCMLDEEVF
jgi:hypothetical protein